MDNLKPRKSPRNCATHLSHFYHYVTCHFESTSVHNVTIVTQEIFLLMKDRTASVLSTDCANKLVTICVKIGFSSHVKAVNGTSSRGYSQLSHFSVDNMV